MIVFLSVCGIPYADYKVSAAPVNYLLLPATVSLAVPLYERFMEQCRRRGFQVEHGTFGADMQVASVNDGPVTILFDTDKNGAGRA